MTAVDWETKIGSGTNFADMRRGCTSSLEEEEVDGDVNSAPTFVEGVPGLLVARLRLFVQQEWIGIG